MLSTSLYLQNRPHEPHMAANEFASLAMFSGMSLSEQIEFNAHHDNGLRPAPYAELLQLKRESRFKLLNTPFNRGGYVAARNVGALVEHRWAHSNLTFDEWVASYTSERLPYASILHLVDFILRDQGMPHTLAQRQFILNVLWTRLFVETDMGFQPERSYRLFLQGLFGSCRTATPREENAAHVDLVCEEPGLAFQVKHKLFLTVARGNQGFRDDQLKNLRAQAHFEQQTGIKVFYLVAEDVCLANPEFIDLPTAVRRCGFSVRDIPGLL